MIQYQSVQQVIGFARAGAISTGDATNLTLDAGTTGLVQIANTSSGNVEIAGGVSATGCTITNATGDLSCSGDITGANTGTVGYWSRDDATQTLTTATDWDNITLGGLLTATGGASFAGTTNINTSGSSAINIGTGSYTGDLTLGNTGANVSITDGSWNITATGAANFVSIGATVPGTGAFTNLSSSGNTILSSGAGSTTTIGNDTGTFSLSSTGFDVSSAGALSGITGYTQSSGDFTFEGSGIASLGTGTGNVVIGNATGTFSLTSNAGLNVTTAGALTGVAVSTQYPFPKHRLVLRQLDRLHRVIQQI